MARAETYGADVPISLPMPSGRETRVPMFGFAFTDAGIAHDISEADFERLSMPTFAPPQDPNLPVIYEDES